MLLFLCLFLRRVKFLCGRRIFDEMILKENQIENLPIPEGELFRKYDDTVFVNLNKTERDNYIKTAYTYIKSLNFKHFYAFDHVKTTVVVSMCTLFIKDKESESLEDCFYDVSNSYWFIYFNEEIKQFDKDDDRINTFANITLMPMWSKSV